MMDEQTYDELEKQIRMTAHTVAGVLDTEKCYIRKTGLKFNVDLHAVVDGDLTVTRGHEIAHQLSDALKEKLPELEHILVHIEPNEDGGE